MKIRLLPSIFILTVFSLILFGCDRDDEKSVSTGPILAEVNETVITPEDFLISIELLYTPEERARYTTPEGKKIFLQLMTVMELFYQEGIRQGMDEEETIKRAVDNYRRYLVYHTLITRNITYETIKRFFQENYFHVAIIKIALPGGADEKAIAAGRSKAEKVLKKLNNGLDFSKAAAKFSDHASKTNGGDPGPIGTSREWPVEILRVAATLKKEGEISAILEIPNGFYILKLIEPYGQLDFKGMTDNIEQIIFNSMVRENLINYSKQLELMSDVKMYPENLDLISNSRADKDKIIIPTLPTPGISPGEKW